MKVRIKFQKKDEMRFVGHLDIMRYFQKAIRRADIAMAYSEGYSPHPVMSFAAPLGVGITSDGEYFDMEVHESLSSKQAVKALNDVSVSGMRVMSYRILPEKAKNAMSIVAAADYRVGFRMGCEPPKGWQDSMLEFYNQKKIKILKKTKKSEKEIDLKPCIYQLEIKDEEIFMRLCTGSMTNIKPELVMEAFYHYLGEASMMREFSIMIHRLEIYADMGDEHKKNFVPLEELGEEIGG